MRQSHERCGYWSIALGALVALGCGAVADLEEETGSIAQAAQQRTIDTHRSLVVTEQTILERFSLQRVFEQLVSQSGVTGLTATQLFQQWWDTQNPGPGTYAGAHCDDHVDTALGTVLNGYPYFCRDEAEGTQVECDPFSVDSPCAYLPIGLFNRFDQAPENGAHCGEYRIVYAKATGLGSTSDRNLLIFEAVLPNPVPQQGLKGCQLIAEAWYDLTAMNDIEDRADALEDFYFDGQGNIGPVISVSNFGDNALFAGQIRTNQFSNTTSGWSLREFKLLRTCTQGVCSAMQFVPVTAKTNAFGPLFAPGSTLPAAAAFAAHFPSQVPRLAASSVPGISLDVPDVYNSGQSQASGSSATEMRYLDHFAPGPSTLRADIQSALTTLGSGLTPDEIVTRAQTQTCAGCHRLNNGSALGGGLTWPASLGFTHVTERETEVVGGHIRFKLSDALLYEFLPARKIIFEDFLNNRPRPSRAPNHPLSGSKSHG